MTRTSLGALALLLGSAGLAEAGALDRTLTPIGVIFEDGNYAELSFGFTSPEVTGTDPASGASSGNVGVDYSVPVLSFKYDVTDRIAVAVVVDQPYGADVDYDDSDAPYPVAGSSADFRSSAVTVLGRYKFNDSFSVHAGGRQVTTDADLFVSAFSGLATYDAEYDSDSDLSYIVGAAYERPAIALRVALTYATETQFNNAVTYRAGSLGVVGPETEAELDYTLPQTLTLDFRSGIAANTLLFGQVRWSDWSETEIVSPGYFANPVVDYDADVYTYTLGVGRKFSDRISAATSIIYESPTEEEGDVSNLSPTDGQLGFQIGGTYAMDSGIELTAGLRYTRLGDAVTRTINAEFEDNSAVSLGLRVGYRF